MKQDFGVKLSQDFIFGANLLHNDEPLRTWVGAFQVKAKSWGNPGHSQSKTPSRTKPSQHETETVCQTWVTCYKNGFLAEALAGLWCLPLAWVGCASCLLPFLHFLPPWVFLLCWSCKDLIAFLRFSLVPPSLPISCQSCLAWYLFLQILPFHRPTHLVIVFSYPYWCVLASICLCLLSFPRA